MSSDVDDGADGERIKRRVLDMLVLSPEVSADQRERAGELMDKTIEDPRVSLSANRYDIVSFDLELAGVPREDRIAIVDELTRSDTVK